MMKHSRKPCLHGVYAGLFGKVFTAFIAAAAVTLAYGEDYYVDANNGNDAWDGKTAVIPDQATIDAGGTIAGPRKTLHAMMSDERVVAGDTVWAAEGDYNEGGTVNGEGKTINRVQVKAGVALKASGARSATFITGSGGEYSSKDPSKNAYTNGAVRCVFFLAVPKGAGYACGIVKGFTLQDGRAGSEEANKEYGGASFGAGLLVECDFLDNGCCDKNRGGTMNEGTALRCRFVSYDRGFLGYEGTKIIDSLVESSRPFYDSCYAYNCTFSGDSYLRSKGRARNCLYIGGGATNSSQTANSTSSYHYNTFSYFEFYDGCTLVDDNCRVVNSKTAPYDPATFRPSVNSQAIDGGTLENYALATNGWKQAWLDECGKDYYGGERVVNGKIDVGCGEFQGMDTYKLAISDDDNALIIDGAEIGEEQFDEDFNKELTFSRKFTSEKLLAGIEINGEFYSFGGTTNDYPVTVSLKWKFGTDYVIKAVYEENQKDWYVSPSGDNANKGYHRKWPLRTLDKAMELAKENAGHIVHAAAGTYDSFAEGEEYASANSRVTVKAGVGLVADEWPLKETVIKGASDTTSETADKYGNGPNAVRCVTVEKNGYVRGFKLTGGRTDNTEDAKAARTCGGGAYLKESAALIDCEITGNGTGNRGSVAYSPDSFGWLIRCYAHGNDENGGNYQIYDKTSIVDTYVDGGEDFAYYCRSGSIILNSTIVGGARAWANISAYNSYITTASMADKTKGYKFSLNNCAFARIRENSGVDDVSIVDENNTCFYNVAKDDNLGDDLRPKTASVLIDAGVNDNYDTYFPTQFEQFRNDRDVADGQRVYNGKIDIGCGEYDFRGDFARMLGSRGMIEEMGPNVTTNAAQNVVVPEGESIAVSVTPKSPDRNTHYELVYTPDDGSQTKISESSTDIFSYTLEGPCTIQTLNGYIGFVFQVR